MLPKEEAIKKFGAEAIKEGIKIGASIVMYKLRGKDQEATDLYDKGEGDFQYADYYRGYIAAITDAIDVCDDIEEAEVNDDLLY